MKNKYLHSKRAVLPVLLILLLSVAGLTNLQAQNITFADANVKAICVANWDTNGDGELSQTEAAAVTSLDGMFMFDDEITTFDELSFFTGLTSIGEDEFNSCTNLTAISIPNTVTSIYNYAFSDCSSLATITIYAFTPPTLGSYVFDNVPSTVTIKVPNGTAELYQTTIGWDGFIHYEEFIYGLWPISFADTDVKAICVTHWDTNGDGELSYAEAAAVTNLGTYFKSTAITSFDELEYFTSLTSIPNTAFYGCTSLVSIALPSSISALGNGSFYNCTNLATMTVYAETPPTVGTNAFKNVPTDMMVYVPCGTDDIYSNANGWSVFTNIQELRTCPIVFADANVKALCVANWDTNGDGELSFAEAAAVTSLGTVFKNQNYNITIFDELQYFTGLSSIGYQAFYNCYGLTSIEIPNSVTSIGSYAFCSCSSLTSIEIPNSVTSIFNGAFEDCSGLTSIEIPNSVTSISSLAFYGCSSLTSIEIPNSVTSIDSRAFGSCNGLEQIVVDSENTVYDSRNGCNGIVKTSTNELVAGCKNTVIPNSVTSIGSYAFNTGGLTSIEIPNSVTSIGSYAFYNCYSLTSVEIPNSVTSIGSYAFYDCTNLTSIEIPNSVTSIGSYAFEYCSSLTSIEIPNSMTSIGERAFGSCYGIEQIIVDPENTVYDSRNGCNGIINTNTNSLVVGCKNTVIPNSVTSIGNYAFRGCSGLTSIEIPNSVISIGSYAFDYCSGLTSMTVLAYYPPTLSNFAFNNFSKSIPVYVPCASMLAYQDASGWNQFTNYMPVSECESGEITAVANPTEGGMVTGSGFYEGGAICTFTATANAGYAFANWTKDGEVVSLSEIYNFKAEGDAILVANFNAIPPVPVVAEYYPEPNEPNSPNVKVHWAAVSPEAQIGESTISTFGYFPFYTLYNYSIAENLFLASELAEAGFTSSPMTSLSWYATNQTGYAQQGISIWMANVSDTELTTTSHTVNDMTLVYTGSMTPEIGWNEFVFNEGTFAWDGVSNVLIFCQRNNGAWNSTVYWQASNAGFNASSYKYTDYGPYNVNVANTMNNISTTRPNIIMKGEGGISYNLYRANCDGTEAQMMAENLSDTLYIDETWEQLEDGNYKYGVSFSAGNSPSSEIFWSNCIEKQGSVAVQTTALSQGWNWFSTNLEITLDDLKSALVTALPSTTIIITSQSNGSTTYNGTMWRGNLNTLDVKQMYMIQVSAACEITLTGMPINPVAHPVTIHNGLNWIAFPLSGSMTLSNAFSGFAVNGDMVSSQSNGSAIYTNQWRGQLGILEPGKGYMYKSNVQGDRFFTFPISK